MRDPGLSEAIQAAGGVSELARRVGISQPSVSNWDKVPAERVLVVEAATGVNRKVLRPDLYQRARSAGQGDRRDRCRARAGIRAALRAAGARARRGAAEETVRAARRRDARSASRMSRSREAAAETSVERIEREYFDLFIGLGRGELLPYASYYLTGFLHERPLARLRDGSRRRSASSASKATTSPRITPRPCARSWRASSAAACRRRTAPTGASSRNIFRPGSDASSPIWSARTRPASTGSVGTLGRVFMEIEKEAFALPS